MLFEREISLKGVTLMLALLINTATCRPPPEDAGPILPGTITLQEGVVKTIAPPYGSKGPGRTGSTNTKSFKELQLNLCNGGGAKCYEGGLAVPEGSRQIYKLAPNVVTVNEICLGDLANGLHPALSQAWPDDYTYSAFNAAFHKLDKGPYKCKNGDLFGNAVLGRIPGGKKSEVVAYGGRYAAQDVGENKNEQRTFVCAHAKGDHFACATHLSALKEETALAQCKALMFDAVPYLTRRAGSSGPTVVGGDFNLEYATGDAQNAQNCVPNGYTRKGDRNVQHVIFSNDLHFEDENRHSMSHTDHKAFEVKLTRS